MKKILSLITLFVFGAGVLFSGSALAGDYAKQKVVYHINYDNPKKQTGALRNIQNHINAVSSGPQILDSPVVAFRG